MDSGQRLLGALELAGAVLITTGLAVRAAALRICYKPYINTKLLVGNRVLIIGADNILQQELANQFILRGCRVARAGLSSINNNTSETFYACNPSKPNELNKLAKRINDEFGNLDIVIYITDITQTSRLEPVEEIADIVENNLMEHFHVVSQFVPDLARRSGCYVEIQSASASTSGTFSSAKSALTSLSDSITQQLGNNVHIIRAIRRTRRQSDQEDIAESATAILNAIETGQSSITLPTAKQHIKNVFRYIFIELSQLWNDTIRQQKLN